MNKNNINLLVYSPTLESRIKYWFKFILFLIRYILFYLTKKNICACIKIFIGLFTDARVRNKNTDLICLFCLFVFFIVLHKK